MKSAEAKTKEPKNSGTLNKSLKATVAKDANTIKSTTRATTKAAKLAAKGDTSAAEDVISAAEDES